MATLSPSVSIHVLSNDSDMDGDPLTIRVVSQPLFGTGTAVVDDNGTPGDSRDDFINFVPAPGLGPGVYSFTYLVNDGHADGNFATVTVRMIGSDFGGTVTRDDRPGPHPVNLHRIDGKAIQAPGLGNGAVTTWVVIHGRNDSPYDQESTIPALAVAVDDFASSDQVLVLDWSEEAAASSNTDFSGADWIIPVGEWAARTLTDLQIPFNLINLVGHSWGSYVAYEIGNFSDGSVNALVALDPARDSRDIPGTTGNSFDTSNVGFRSVSRYSWAFQGSFAGNEMTAATARATFAMYVPGPTFDVTHGNVVRLFTSMLLLSNHSTHYVSHYFSLNNLLDGWIGPWELNSLPSYAGYEAVIKGTQVGIVWTPTSVQFLQVGNVRPIRESVQPDSRGRYVVVSPIGQTLASASTVSRSPFNGSTTLENWVGIANNSEYYTFTLDRASIFRMQFQGSTSNAVAVLLDSNGNRWDSASTAYHSSSVQRSLPAGRYFIKITYIQVQVGYRLTDPDNPYRLNISAGIR